MKKLLFFGLAILLFAGLNSCETEPADVDNLEIVYGKGKLKSNDSGEDKCETAFGRVCDCTEFNSCFSNFGINRWGWSVRLPNPGSGDFNLFAGAGQCDLNKGTFVGTVHITFSDDKSISYDNVNLIDGWELKELHLYSGDEPLPRKKKGDWTVAPGQYTNYGDVDGNGEVYVIVHADVCQVGS